MLDEKWRKISSGPNVWDLLTEFSETCYSFLTPAIWGGSKKKNNCQSTHYRVVQKCLGKLNKKLDVKPHMISKVTRAIADATKKTHTGHRDEVYANLREKIFENYSKGMYRDLPVNTKSARGPMRRLTELSGFRTINRLLRETKRAFMGKAGA